MHLSIAKPHFRTKRSPALMSRRLIRVGAVAGFVIVLSVFPTTISGANYSAGAAGTVSISISIPVQAQPDPTVAKLVEAPPSEGVLSTPSVPTIILPAPEPSPVVTPAPAPSVEPTPAPLPAPAEVPAPEPSPAATPVPAAPAPEPEQPTRQEGQPNAEVSP